MEAIPTIILVSLTNGVMCTYLFWRPDQKPYMARETYKTLSAISFIFHLTGSFLCMYRLAVGG